MCRRGDRSPVSRFSSIASPRSRRTAGGCAEPVAVTVNTPSSENQPRVLSDTPHRMQKPGCGTDSTRRIVREVRKDHSEVQSRLICQEDPRFRGAMGTTTVLGASAARQVERAAAKEADQVGPERRYSDAEIRAPTRG